MILPLKTFPVKTLFVFSFLCTIFLSACGDKKIIKTEFLLISGKKIQWYFYSYITDNSDGRIDIITKNGESETIFINNDICDLGIGNDTLFIHVNPGSTTKLRVNIAGLTLNVDSSGCFKPFKQ